MHAGTALGNLVSALGIRQEEADLITQLKAGSEEAFAWLVATYHQPVYSLIARTLPNPADAADITQEVFVKIYRGISGFHGDASLRTWIYRIALHEASNQRRWWSRHRRQEVTIEAETGDSIEGQSLCIRDTLVDEHESPFEMAAQSELRSRVEAELRQVPDPFRTVVILRDIEGLAYEEIAEILGINLGTVKSRLMRGRANLKARLAQFAEAARKRPTPTLETLHPAEEVR
ncbi:MAG TPA: sigma-70 family RNA polymerase sigma factor [Silvibacterium sp.]|jgi:RNA polymerase sigma-70 factor (ECF subfamily)|nr:sigma-70 family RNA polymerase sigma factor [Silvibacterium sp.]